MIVLGRPAVQPGDVLRPVRRYSGTRLGGVCVRDAHRTG